MLELRQPAAGLQHYEFTHHVGVDVGVGVLKRMPDAGLGGEVDDLVQARLAINEREHRFAIGDVQLMKRKAIAPFEPVQARQLQGGVVIVV